MNTILDLFPTVKEERLRKEEYLSYKKLREYLLKPFKVINVQNRFVDKNIIISLQSECEYDKSTFSVSFQYNDEDKLSSCHLLDSNSTYIIFNENSEDCDYYRNICKRIFDFLVDESKENKITPHVKFL